MDGIEDSKRAATLRAIWPAVLHAMRGNPPTVFWLAAATGHAYPIPKSLVNRLPGSAHGTRATTTPCSAHASRGAKPMSSTPWRPKSWWRRRRLRPVVALRALAPAANTGVPPPAPHPDHRRESGTQRGIVRRHVLNDHAFDVRQSFEWALRPRRFLRLCFLVEKQTCRKRPSHIGIQRLTDEPPPTRTTEEPFITALINGDSPTETPYNSLN